MYALPHCQDAFMFLFTNLEWKMQSFLCGGTERVIAISSYSACPISVPCILQESVSLVSTHKD
jgi:hypothetical protein